MDDWAHDEDLYDLSYSEMVKTIIFDLFMLIQNVGSHTELFRHESRTIFFSAIFFLTKVQLPVFLDLLKMIGKCKVSIVCFVLFLVNI